MKNSFICFAVAFLHFLTRASAVNKDIDTSASSKFTSTSSVSKPSFETNLPISVFQLPTRREWRVIGAAQGAHILQEFDHYIVATVQEQKPKVRTQHVDYEKTEALLANIEYFLSIFENLISRREKYLAETQPLINAFVSSMYALISVTTTNARYWSEIPESKEESSPLFNALDFEKEFRYLSLALEIILKIPHEIEVPNMEIIVEYLSYIVRRVVQNYFHKENEDLREDLTRQVHSIDRLLTLTMRKFGY